MDTYKLISLLIIIFLAKILKYCRASDEYFMSILFIRVSVYDTTIMRLAFY